MSAKPPATKPPFKRSQVVIDPKFQFGLIGAFVAAAVFVNIFIWIACRQLFTELRNVAPLLGFDQNSIYHSILDSRLQSATTFLIVSSIAMIIIFATIGLVISHRVVGPLYNLKKHLTRVVEEGVTSNIKFRDKDYFVDLADLVNRLMDKLRKNGFK